MLTNQQKLMLFLLLRRRRRNRFQKQMWIHPLNLMRPREGHYHTIMNHLRNDNTKFYNFYRMTQASFDELLILLEPHIRKKDTSFRQSISPEERLAMTLR